MTPKEKAKQLVDSFYQLFPLDKDVNTTDGELNWKYNDWNQSKKAALIAVDEIIKNQDNVIDIMRYKLILGGIKSITMQSDYWNNVKRYIEEL